LYQMPEYVCRDVTRLDGAGARKQVWRRSKKTSLAPLCANLSSFRSQFTVLKQVHVILLGFRRPSESFGAPRSDLTPPWCFGARGIMPPRYTSVYLTYLKCRTTIFCPMDNISARKVIFYSIC